MKISFKNYRNDQKGTEENDENREDFEKFLPDLLQVVSKDADQSVELALDYVNSNKNPPEPLLKKVVEYAHQHMGAGNTGVTKQLHALVKAMLIERQELPSYLRELMLRYYPLVLWTGHFAADLPVPKDALEKIYQNPFQVAAMVREILKRDKPIPSIALKIMEKNPTEAFYMLGAVVQDWEQKKAEKGDSNLPLPVPLSILRSMAKRDQKHKMNQLETFLKLHKVPLELQKQVFLPLKKKK